MPQFGGKPKKSSPDTKRHFTVVIEKGGKGGGLVPPKEHGLYVSSTPSSAARKAVTKLCAANKSKKVEFHIREITQGSKKKTYGPYIGYIEKLKEPIELKGRVIKYKPVAKLSRKKGKMKGGGKTREDLIRIANEWVGHGTYVLDNNSMIVKNQSKVGFIAHDEYIPFDFLIKFTNYGQFEFEKVKELFKFLYPYSDARYKDKSLAMNCWQFVLLCLLESEYINEEQLKILYHNFDNNTNEKKRLPDYFGKKYSDGKPGDIILFQRKRDGIIWHVAILTEIKGNGDVIEYEYIQMLRNKVYKSIYIYNEQELEDNLLFITPENLIEPIVSLKSDELKIEPATYDKHLLKWFLVNIYFKDEILEYAKNRLEELIKSIPSPINYEELFKNFYREKYLFIKNSQVTGVNYTHGNSNFYEKRFKEKYLNDPELKNHILASHNLLRFTG
jgi:hypothetical protein